MLWLTPDFPLKTEEVLPLLDILTNKVKAVRRLRELLTTKPPTGTFPVKVNFFCPVVDFVSDTILSSLVLLIVQKVWLRYCFVVCHLICDILSEDTFVI